MIAKLKSSNNINLFNVYNENLKGSILLSHTEDGVVTALKEGTASVIVKVGGDGVYAENSTTVTVSVSKVPTEISVDPASLDLVVGNESSIAATLTPADAGNLTYTSMSPSVIKVENGKLVAVAEGKVAFSKKAGNKTVVSVVCE